MRRTTADFEPELEKELRAYIALLLRWERYLHFRSALSREIELVAEQSKQQAETVKKLAQSIRQHDEAKLVDLQQKIPRWSSYLKQLDEVQQRRPRRKGTQPFLIEP